MRQLADSDGAITLARTYDPYGVVTTSTGPSSSGYGFTGEYQQDSLVYLRARHYAPGMGRFLTRDTWEGDSSQPMSYNVWLYGYANPIRYTDPSGLVSCDSLVTFSSHVEKVWKESEKKVVCRQVNDIANAYAKVMNRYKLLLWQTGESTRYSPYLPPRAFHLVHGGPVKFYRSKDKPGWAGRWTNNQIEIYDIENSSGYLERHPRLVTHEMGHVFLTAIGATATKLNFNIKLLRPWENGYICNKDTSIKDKVSYYGYAGPFEQWQFGYYVSEPDARWKEEMADMYIGWVYGKWEDSNLGRERSIYINTVMFTQLIKKIPENDL